MNSRTKKILYYMSRGILIIIAVGLSAWFLNSSFRTASSENEKETILIQTIASGLNELHYRPVKIDDDFSKKLYKTYLERLDSRKIFFNKKDMDQLKPFEFQLDDEAKSGTFEMFNKSMELWDAAYKKTQSYYKEFLAQPFDYNKKETIETDGDKLDFAKNDTELKDKIILISKVSDSNMQWLYSNSLFTVFPSFYEGWGLPIAESLGHGKVTIASDTSSIPEVGGSCVEYFSPYSVDDALRCMDKYTDKESRRIQEQYIKDNYKQTSWEDSARWFAEKAQ